MTSIIPRISCGTQIFAHFVFFSIGCNLRYLFVGADLSRIWTGFGGVKQYAPLMIDDAPSLFS